MATPPPNGTLLPNAGSVQSELLASKLFANKIELYRYWKSGQMYCFPEEKKKKKKKAQRG